MKRTTLWFISAAFLANFSLWSVLSREENSEPVWKENTTVVNASENDCADCHDDLLTGKKVHDPVSDDCTSCHNQPGANHPESPSEKVSLVEKMPDLCYICHEAKNTHKYVHNPVASGECVNCHSVHSSNNSALLTEASSGALCASCHDTGTNSKKPVKHSPVSEGECTICHNPHESDQAQLLVNTKPALCFNCHGDLGEQASFPSVHAPFTDDCSTCHAMHESAEKDLLIEKPTQLCIACHEPFGDKKSTHGPVKEGQCASCHSPHASKESHLLVKNGQDLCLNCHNKEIKTEKGTIPNLGKKLKSSTNIHGAIEMDGCATCHDAHGSDNQKLLRNTFPEDIYTDATAESFALCFDCHDATMLDEGNGPLTTNFRDGSRNLHRLHINGPKGRSCSLCHDMHASNNKHLMADKVMFGTWEMPLNYKADINGGSCATGCHAKKAYVNNTY